MLFPITKSSKISTNFQNTESFTSKYNGLTGETLTQAASQLALDLLSL